MRRSIRRGNIVIESRFFAFSILVLSVTAILALRLWYVQVFKGEYYLQVSQRNRIRKIEIPAPRGTMFDRHGQTILGNRPFFDLVYIPQFVLNPNETLRILSRILHVPESSFERRLRIAGRGPKYLPVTLKRNLSLNEVSMIESNKMFLPGIDINVAPRRDYTPDVSAHLVGYVGEIDEAALNRLNSSHPKTPYHPGDLIGKQGLERRYESYLRGKRGFRFIQVDALGRQTRHQDLIDWELPLQPAIPGQDLELTIDQDLQLAAMDAFKGKYGSVVALNPQNGEVLAIISSPGFDPNLYQEGMSREEWKALISHPFTPLYDKSTGGEYPPGSVYKAVVAIAGLQERVVTPETTVRCPGHYTVGDQTFHCWERGGHGVVALRKALYRSCDVYFYELGIQLGVDKVAEYAMKLGLGRVLGLDLNTEKPGLIPTSAWKLLTQRIPWTKGDSPNIAIGQGYNLTTPLQLANLYATIGNGGKVWRPYLIKRITDHIGRDVYKHEPELLWQISDIRPDVLATVTSMLGDVVGHSEGTGKRAAVKGYTVAGKTGSAQVVSLKKNRNFEDVSMKWKEHALFAAFAPTDQPEIAVSVVSEHDSIGGGGAAAAPVAGAVIHAYFELKEKRKRRSVVQTDEAATERL